MYLNAVDPSFVDTDGTTKHHAIFDITNGYGVGQGPLSAMWQKGFEYNLGSPTGAPAPASLGGRPVDLRMAVLPTAPERLLGLANFAGEIIPAYDSSKLLDLPAFHASHLVLLETSEGLAGITASDLPFPADLMEAAPGFLAHHNEIIPLFDAEQALVAP